VMISFLRSSEEIFPEVRVVNCDQDFTWSPSTLVKSGETYVDFLGSSSERWGDYTGIARRHSNPSGNVWLAGCYGANINSQNTQHTFKTWVAEIAGGDVVGNEEVSPMKNVSVYPNPAYNLIRIDFIVDQRELTTITLFDMNGKPVKVLYRDMPKPGVNQLTFNKGALPAGSYLISITTSTQILKNEKLIILD
jgi:WD40 repeat protein